jgi:hypothetical protein
MVDGYIQVPTDSTGKKVQSREMRVILDDGTLATVQMQVISIADKDGRFVDLDTSSTLDEILEVLREMKQMMELGQGSL